MRLSSAAGPSAAFEGRILSPTTANQQPGGRGAGSRRKGPDQAQAIWSSPWPLLRTSRREGMPGLIRIRFKGVLLPGWRPLATSGKAEDCKILLSPVRIWLPPLSSRFHPGTLSFGLGSKRSPRRWAFRTRRTHSRLLTRGLGAATHLRCSRWHALRPARLSARPWPGRGH